jgi:Ca2+-binding RTX toxin-like protein
MPVFPALFQLSSLDGTNGFEIGGEALTDRSGRSVSAAGDVNGDGFGDVIVGAHEADPVADRSGASYVVFGKASGFSADLALSSLDGTNGFQIGGEADMDFSGTSLSEAGDVNGDGFGDLIVGAPYADPNGNNSGAAYVVFGKASGFAADLALSSLDGSNGFQISGAVEGDRCGCSVSAAGDVNGDGFGDVIVGAPYADPNGDTSGAAYVVFGKAGGFAANLVSTFDGANGFQIAGETVLDQSGFSVSGAGDVNADGFGDVIVGGFGADPGGVNGAGASHVVFGHATGTLDRTGTEARDILSGGEWDDRFSGLGGDDWIRSGAGDDWVSGGLGADTLTASGGDDTVLGGSGNDTLDGGSGNDVMRGGSGRDIFLVSAGEDSLDGGSEKDQLNFAGLGAVAIAIDLSTASTSTR